MDFNLMTVIIYSYNIDFKDHGFKGRGHRQHCPKVHFSGGSIYRSTVRCRDHLVRRCIRYISEIASYVDVGCNFHHCQLDRNVC